LQVPFHDVDPMRVVWHGNYLKYFDAARQALFDQAGLDLYAIHEQDGLLFPVTRMRVKYVHPLRFRDEFDCRATLVEATCRIVMDFEIKLAADGVVCVKGQSEQVAVRMPQGTLELRLPREVRRAFGQATDGC